MTSAIESIAAKLRAQSEQPIDKCRDVTLPSDLEGYVPGKLCDYCWSETPNGTCDCKVPPLCEKCNRRHF